MQVKITWNLLQESFQNTPSLRFLQREKLARQPSVNPKFEQCVKDFDLLPSSFYFYEINNVNIFALDDLTQIPQ